jgi:hypothetical protein
MARPACRFSSGAPPPRISFRRGLLTAPRNKNAETADKRGKGFLERGPPSPANGNDLRGLGTSLTSNLRDVRQLF